VFGTCSANGDLCGRSQCVDGSCGNGTCGGLDQQCCVDGSGNSTCTAPDTRCLDGTCQACGGNNERCCVDRQSGNATYCSPPFNPTFTSNNVCFCQ
jgi:hypothetical protein